MYSSFGWQSHWRWSLKTMPIFHNKFFNLSWMFKGSSIPFPILLCSTLLAKTSRNSSKFSSSPWSRKRERSFFTPMFNMMGIVHELWHTGMFLSFNRYFMMILINQGFVVIMQQHDQHQVVSAIAKAQFDVWMWWVICKVAFTTSYNFSSVVSLWECSTSVSHLRASNSRTFWTTKSFECTFVFQPSSFRAIHYLPCSISWRTKTLILGCRPMDWKVVLWGGILKCFLKIHPDGVCCLL